MYGLKELEVQGWACIQVQLDQGSDSALEISVAF